MRFQKVTEEILLKSGDSFKVRGCYGYHSHVNPDEDEGCLVTRQASTMFFSKGEKVPGLGSCTHDVYWKLDATC